MKTLHKAIFLAALSLLSIKGFGQTATDAKTLVNQGVALNDAGKYAEAIEKYNQAIKLDPKYETGYYEMAYTLFTTNKGADALPFLNKLITLNPQSAAAYDMLGSIYDDMKQSDKAIEYYLKGIQSDSTYQRLHYNLAITYYRTGKLPEAEVQAIKAIKLDPKHASSQRIYGMATYGLGKRGASLLAWCSFLMLEPKTARSVEAIKYVKNIVNYGITKVDSKNVNIQMSPDNPSNVMMPIATIAATENKTNLSAIDSLQLQLTSLFQIAHTITMDKTQPFLVNYYSEYFDKLAHTGNMAAFTRYITLSANNDENVAWFKEHDSELKAFQQWANTTGRSF